MAKWREWLGKGARGESAGAAATADVPEPDDAKVDEALREARARLPIPVFWLLGKAQSGKTSIIRALTRSDAATIGDGFRPCTRTASVYSFPDESTAFLRFLDTRGLGEAAYDPSEDIAQFQERAHLLLIVVKAMDHALQPVLEPLKKIRKLKPDWPVIVVQSTLHEGYPRGMGHPQPYPFAGNALPGSLPADLARSLASQREAFGKLADRFVPIDFTRPGDGLEPLDYGLEELWDAIEHALPLGLRAMMAGEREAFSDQAFRKAHPEILSHALAAGAAAGIPVPYADIPLVLAVQARMFRAVAAAYHQPMDARRIGEILGAMGLTMLGRLGVRELLKVVPGYGSAIAGAYAAASTYGLGRALAAYFGYLSEGGIPDSAVFRRLYEQEFREGRERLASYLKGSAPS